MCVCSDYICISTGRAKQWYTEHKCTNSDRPKVGKWQYFMLCVHDLLTLLPATKNITNIKTAHSILLVNQTRSVSL